MLNEEGGDDGRVATDSIPPSVLLDRILERNNRSIEEGFARIDRRLDDISQRVHDGFVTLGKWVGISAFVLIVLLMARDFVKLNLEAPGGFRLETSTLVGPVPVPAAPPVSAPVEPAPSPDTSLVQ